MAYYSPLRYPGGKGRLSNYMKLVIIENNLLNGTYIEPFAGGAGIALSLLINKYVSKIIINDISKSIYCFWYSILNYTEDFCKIIYNTPVTVDEWFKQKEIQENPDEFSEFKLGFSTFYLNRTNRSGILKGGVIGGIEQNSKYKIDARYNKDKLVSRIKRIARYKDRIYLYNLDAEDLIEDVIPNLSLKSLIYLDPPYYNKGIHLYENYYNHNDHLRLSRKISQINHKWIITYDNVQDIKKFYEEYKQRTYSLSYSAANRYKGSEIMIYSNNLVVPKVEDPVKVKISNF
jgi:DNA adenine methylase